MSTTEASPFAARGEESAQHLVNDFSIQIATVNGSGSQTANAVLMRSIFQRGVPVSGKNLFPSNIQGLPTWFSIRASRHGHIGRKKETDSTRSAGIFISIRCRSINSWRQFARRCGCASWCAT